MTWFFVMVAIWIVMAKRRRGWMRRQQHFARLGGDPGWQGSKRRHRHRELPAPPVESRFDVLKRRFVAGELSEVEYEREVDALLRQPGGMGEI